jgi:signal transduction histidine kinase
VVKPFSARELLVCIASRLEISRLRKSNAESEHRLFAEAETERQKLRDLIAQAPALVAILRGPDHVFEMVNREYAKATGRSERDLIGKPVRDALPEIGTQVFIDLLDEVYTTGKPFIGTEMLAKLDRRGDGTLEDRYFNFVYQVWKDASGCVQGIFVHAVDVSEQVFVRQRIEQSEQTLRTLVDKEREARTTAELLNRVGPTLLSQLDFEALVQSVTDIATELIGAEVGAFVRNQLNDSENIASPYTISGPGAESFRRLGLSRWLLSASSTGTPVFWRNDTGTNIDASSPQDESIRGSLLSVPVVSRSGEVLGRLIFGHPEPRRFNESHEAIITGIAAQAAIAMDNARLFEQAQWVQNELKRSNDELRHVNRDLEVFAYSASHDLQEPLRNIAISAELIEAGLGRRLSGEEAIFLKTIVVSAKNMRGLIDDLLAYTRATKDEEGLPPSVDSEQVLAGVLDGLRNSIEGSGASVTTDRLPNVGIHERPLAQLFQNLIGNAIKYRTDERPRVHISAEERDGWCIFSVTDNGIGIEPQFSEQVFGLFKRLHTRDEYPGSGIGLAICQRLVEKYGGRIWLDHSEPGRGSTFCFAVPPPRSLRSNQKNLDV